MNRREFLKYSLATGALIAAGDGMMEDLMAHAATGINEVDKLTIWVVTDNYYDANVPDSKITKKYRVVPGKSIHAEHGLSFYVETVTSGRSNLRSLSDLDFWKKPRIMSIFPVAMILSGNS